MGLGGSTTIIIKDNTAELNRLTDKINTLNTDCDNAIKEGKKLKTLFKEFKDAVEKEKEESADPKNYDKVNEDRFDKYTDMLGKTQSLIPHDHVIGTPGNNVAFLGNISAGKSTLVNWLLKILYKVDKLTREQRCKVGKGEVTQLIELIKSFPEINLWDFPGKHEAQSYYDFEIIKKITSMRTVCVLFESSTKEVTRMIRILEALKINYLLIRTKADLYELTEEEIEDGNKTLTDFNNDDHTYLKELGFDQKIYSISIENLKTNKKNNNQDKDIYDWELVSAKMLAKKNLMNEYGNIIQ